MFDEFKVKFYTLLLRMPHLHHAVTVYVDLEYIINHGARCSFIGKINIDRYIYKCYGNLSIFTIRLFIGNENYLVCTFR